MQKWKIANLMHRKSLFNGNRVIIHKRLSVFGQSYKRQLIPPIYLWTTTLQVSKWFMRSLTVLSFFCSSYAAQPSIWNLISVNERSPEIKMHERRNNKKKVDWAYRGRLCKLQMYSTFFLRLKLQTQRARAHQHSMCVWKRSTEKKRN